MGTSQFQYKKNTKGRNELKSESGKKEWLYKKKKIHREGWRSCIGSVKVGVWEVLGEEPCVCGRERNASYAILQLFFSVHFFLGWSY